MWRREILEDSIGRKSALAESGLASVAEAHNR